MLSSARCFCHSKKGESKCILKFLKTRRVRGRGNSFKRPHEGMGRGRSQVLPEEGVGLCTMVWFSSAASRWTGSSLGPQGRYSRIRHRYQQRLRASTVLQYRREHLEQTSGQELGKPRNNTQPWSVRHPPPPRPMSPEVLTDSQWGRADPHSLRDQTGCPGS